MSGVVGFTATLSHDGHDAAYANRRHRRHVRRAGRADPYILIGFSFTFLYVLVPNTRVRFKPALIGAYSPRAMGRQRTL